MKNDGWIKLNRKIRESYLWKLPEGTFKLAIHLLITVPFKDEKVIWSGSPVELGQGQVVTSIAVLAKETRLTNRQVRTGIKNLEKIGFLTNESTKQGRRLSLTPDWVSGPYGIFGDKQHDKQATNERQTESLRALQNGPVNEPKNLKKEKKYNIYSKREFSGNKISSERLHNLSNIGRL
jgi:biotin operon repressor